MKKESSHINHTLFAAVLLGAAALFYVGWQRVAIDTDIVASLPHSDPVIDDALHIFQNHPMQDQVTIDVGIDIDDPDLLVDCGRTVAGLLEQSGLFESVGMADIREHLPGLVDRVLGDLPVLFTARMLERDVAPLLEPGKIDAAIRRWQQELLQLGGFGQSGYISRDPLGLKDRLLARLLYLAPSQNARMHQDQLISSDGRHLLVTATPAESATNTVFARRLSERLAQTGEQVRRAFISRGATVTLTAVGAYRAALDNEVIIRADVRNAILFATLGIAVLLLLAFPRPLIGLLSLLPAMVGTVTAFFAWSLLHRSISIMVLGFGGAIISITVDHGIAYLLFLDRPERASGKTASREVWAVGLLATLTTVGAFSALTLSDFAIFRQLGQFAAMGIAFSFLFVHTVFPRIFPSLSASRPRRLPLPGIADRLFGLGPAAAWAALVFFGVMAFFARPGFNADVSTMNTVSKASLDAEKTVMAVWGDIFNKVYLLIEADSLAGLQARTDDLLTRMEAESEGDLQRQAFFSSMFFPGPCRRAANLTDWRRFWSDGRVAGLRRSLDNAAERYGFSTNAFDPFFNLVTHPEDHLQPEQENEIPEAFFSLMGIVRDPDTGTCRQFSSLALPADYPGQRFFSTYGDKAAIFDPDLFSRHLGDLMIHTFSRLIYLIAPAIFILLLVFFFDAGLSLIAMVPVVFAMVCTLGTLTLAGRSLDIPSLMLAPIILGMGIDYALFLVRSYQRYGRADHPSFTLIRSAVIMTSTSTLIGFGVLVFARHSLLRSAGITSLLGIGYSALGAFLLLPPLLRRRFGGSGSPLAVTGDIQSRVRRRYAAMEPYVRFFAQFKMRLDPMFRELPGLFAFSSPPRVLIDIGSGFGVPACWLAESFPAARLFGIEPDPDRVRVANRALGRRGAVTQGLAPDLPDMPPDDPPVADGAFMLDMMHFLSDDDFRLVLQRLRGALKPDGWLIIRAVMVPERKTNVLWWLAARQNKLVDLKTFYRTSDQIKAILTGCGFAVQGGEIPSGRRRELIWFKSCNTPPVVRTR
jgi:predicted exporter/SAM-dependent methyltransferase